ncbi:LacI family DNA-binding transcriptional regulator [Mucisphaera calidilacus]|uniref:Lac repressor n=1 Tax=Mucisphaera calidilacus TaxID=2527982 RepID=A0A518BWS8_9BACT|nr:LacI family DNA-binding transcriptional regulator [Mucisphaera calidilacus]QDU71429.1 lac repressor [Mucisphaera calidilacus]
MSTNPTNKAVLEMASELRAFARRMPDGSQLPSTRELMKRYRVGQATVQLAMESLEREGLLVRQIGRGTFVATPESSVGTATMMILRSDYPSRRGDQITAELQAILRDEGDASLVITYSSMDMVVDMLQGGAQPDAIILQPMLPTVPLAVLGALHRVSRVVVVDHAIDGVDVDAVGIDWRAGLTQTVRHLQSLGHIRIALSSGEPASAWAQLALYYDMIDGLGSENGPTLDGTVITAQTEQGGSATGGMREAMKAVLRENNGKLPFTALIISSYASAVGAFEAFSEFGINVPQDLSVIVLDSPDLGGDFEHVPLTMVGCTSLSHARALVDLAHSRLKEPHAPHGCVWQVPEMVVRDSIASIPAAGGVS